MSSLFTKYHVRTSDEQPLDAGCFVLRPFNSDGTVRDPAAVAALRTYANFLPAAERELRAEITDWVDTPGLNPATRELNVPKHVARQEWKQSDAAELVRRLRDQSRGVERWRVQEKGSKAWCIQFESWEEPEARKWFQESQDRGTHLGYELAKVRVLTVQERLMEAAADVLDATLKIG